MLDLCSSWISHLPDDLKLGRVAGLGMNEEELKRNGRLTEYVVQDLNEEPKLPYDDESFDYICNVVSVDYLNKPREIFQEMFRVLRPGGTAIMSFSNRCFPCVAAPRALRPWPCPCLGTHRARLFGGSVVAQDEGHCHLGSDGRCWSHLDRGLLLQVLGRLVERQGL